MTGNPPRGSTPFAAFGQRGPAELRLVLAQRLREHRIAHNWTQREMALRSGIAFETYRVFERTGRISLERFLRALAVLGLLDRVELIPPVDFQSIDDVVNQHDKPPRMRARSVKRSRKTESSQ